MWVVKAAAHYWPSLWLVLQLEMGEHMKDVWYYHDGGATHIALAVHDIMGHGSQTSVLIHATT
jgi:hypothetical protein